MYLELLVGVAFNTSLSVTEDLRVLIREKQKRK